MLNSKRISDLEAKVTGLEADLAAANGKAAGLEQELNQARIDLAAAQEEAKQVAALKTQITTLEGQVSTLTTRATQAENDLAASKKDFDTKVETEVTTRLAAAGQPPIARDPKVKTDEPGSQKADTSIPVRQRAVTAMKGFKIFGGN